MRKRFDVAFSQTGPANVFAPPANVRIIPRTYSRVAVGGANRAELTAFGTLEALWGLWSFINHNIYIYSWAGQIVWHGYIEKVAVDTSTSTARIECKGRMYKAGWNYYETNRGLLEFMDVTSDKHNLGEGSGITRIAQSYQLTGTYSTWNARYVGIPLYMIGTRADTVNVEIQSDAAGIPSGTAITSVTGGFSAATIGATNGYIEGELGADAPVDGTLRWIVVSYTGGTDISNYYQAAVNLNNAYTGGSFHWYNGSTWTAGQSGTGRACDMNFRLISRTQTSEQMSNVVTDIASYTPNTINGLDITPASGLYTSAYRDGMQTHWQVIRALCETGTSAGVRYIADITPNGRLLVRQEPAETTTWTISGDVEIGVSIEKMSNSVRVLYTTQGGEASVSAAQTAWVEDEFSILKYGTKSLRVSSIDLDATSAASKAAAILDMTRYPHATVDMASKSAVVLYGPNGQVVDNCTCPVGYWARVGPRGSVINDSTAALSASLMYIEGAEYNCDSDDYIPTPRNAPSALDIVKVNDG